MAELFDYRSHLLRAVQEFLEGTETSRTVADEIVAACPPTKAFTIGDIVWGSEVSALKDTIIQSDPVYLQRLYRFLVGTSSYIRRGYVNYDLRPEMTPQELECFVKLLEMVNFLDHYPFADVDDARSEYEHRRDEIETTLANMSKSKLEDTEMIHHLVLHEVAAVALNIDIRLSMLVTGHLAPSPGYVSVNRYRKPPICPDATNSINWARRALLSIAGQDWLYLSWCLDEGGLHFSIR